MSIILWIASAMTLVFGIDCIFISLNEKYGSSRRKKLVLKAMLFLIATVCLIILNTAKWA